VGITFLGETSLGVTGTVTVDTPVLAGASLDGGNFNTRLRAQHILLMNSGLAGTDADVALHGELFLEAGQDIIIGHGADEHGATIF